MRTQLERPVNKETDTTYSRLEAALKKFREKVELTSRASYTQVYERGGFLAEHASSYVVRMLTREERHEFMPDHSYTTVHPIVNKFYLGKACIAYYDNKTKKPVIDLAFLSDPKTKDEDISSLVTKMNRYAGKNRFAEYTADKIRKMRERTTWENQKSYS